MHFTKAITIATSNPGIIYRSQSPCPKPRQTSTQFPPCARSHVCSRSPASSPSSAAFWDAYSYLARGGVFANAQTGNVVLFGVRAAAGNWTLAWETLPSIVAYVCGVAVARLLKVRPQKQTFRATLICQALELLVLLVLLFFGRFVPDFCAVSLIAFSAALQNTSFSNIGPWQFNSAMTTSNLRNAVSGWVQLALRETDPKLRGEAIIGSVILLCFAGGALLGGACTLRLPAYPLLPCVVLAAAGMLLTVRERERRLN
jgi:uncharacterized membrane protein YoaK (UPF0700 family)